MGWCRTLEKIVAVIPRRCRKARMIIRTDNSSCPMDILYWYETQREVYLLRRAGQKIGIGTAAFVETVLVGRIFPPHRP